MAKSKRAAACPSGAWSKRRRYRMQILVTLLSICRQLERLHASNEARHACIQIAVLLDSALVREQINPKPSRRHT